MVQLNSAVLLTVFILTVALTANGQNSPSPRKNPPPPPPQNYPPPPPKKSPPPPPPPKKSPPPPPPPKKSPPPPPPPKKSPPPPPPPPPPPKKSPPPPPPPKKSPPPPPPPKKSPPPPPPPKKSPPPPPKKSPPPPPKKSPPPPPPPKKSPPPPPPPKKSPPPPPPPTKSPPPPSPPPPPTKSPPPPPPPTKSPPPPPPPTKSPPPPPPKKVKCSNGQNVNPYCRGVQANCPQRCPQSCTMDCDVTCMPVCVCDKPGACGDPRFTGGDGNSFYFHGRKDRDFCIVSDSDLHINAHFIGKRSPSMTRDFTWIQAIAVLFGEHRLYVGAKKTAVWDNDNDRLEISFDGKQVRLPEVDGAEYNSPNAPALTITRSFAVNTVKIELKGRFKIIANVVPITEEDSRIHNYGVTSDDCLTHLDLQFKFDVLTSNVHGVVGQTYRPDYVNKFDVRTKMPVLGGANNFSTSGLFATDCAVARFRRGEGEAELISDLADLKCSSGMDGPGVVCKK